MYSVPFIVKHSEREGLGLAISEAIIPTQDTDGNPQIIPMVTVLWDENRMIEHVMASSLTWVGVPGLIESDESVEILAIPPEDEEDEEDLDKEEGETELTIAQ